MSFIICKCNTLYININFAENVNERAKNRDKSQTVTQTETFDAETFGSKYLLYYVHYFAIYRNHHSTFV